VTLQGLQTLEARGHDFQTKVPFAAGTVMTRMWRLSSRHLQMRGLQTLLQQLLDARGSGLCGVCH